MLTDREELFIEAYFANNFNATAAYKEVYNPKEKGANASRFANKPHIKAEIQKRMRERLEAKNISAERILDELSKIAFCLAEYDTKDKLKALEMMQKQMGLLTTKVDANVATVINVSIEDE